MAKRSSPTRRTTPGEGAGASSVSDGVVQQHRYGDGLAIEEGWFVLDLHKLVLDPLLHAHTDGPYHLIILRIALLIHHKVNSALPVFSQIQAAPAPLVPEADPRDDACEVLRPPRSCRGSELALGADRIRIGFCLLGDLRKVVVPHPFRQ